MKEKRRKEVRRERAARRIKRVVIQVRDGRRSRGRVRHLIKENGGRDGGDEGREGPLSVRLCRSAANKRQQDDQHDQHDQDDTVRSRRRPGRQS